MRISFADKDLEALCSTQKLQQKKLGSPCATKLRTRLADLQAAARVSDLVAGRPHPLKGDRAGQFAVDLAGGSRLVFEPDPRIDPPVDWSTVTAVCIVFIGDYHD